MNELEFATYPESQLRIAKWFTETDTLVISCSRCGMSKEILAEEILEPLYCIQCDKEELAPKQKKQNCGCKSGISLVPAIINLPDGNKLFIYLPTLMDTPYGPCTGTTS